MHTMVEDGVGAELRLEEVMEHPGTTGHPLATLSHCHHHHLWMITIILIQ